MGLCILSYEGAMCLNLSTVLVMGLMWSSECVENKIFKNKNIFDINKFLCLLSLSCILVGYELASREKTEEKSESTVEQPMIKNNTKQTKFDRDKIFKDMKRRLLSF